MYCISKQFQCFLPVQGTALLPLMRLQDTFYFSPFKNPPSTACDFPFLPLFSNISKGQFLMEALAGLSCLPMTCGRKFLLRDSPPGLLWDSSLLCVFSTSLHLSFRGPQIPQHTPRPNLESSPWITSLHHLFPTSTFSE